MFQFSHYMVGKRREKENAKPGEIGLGRAGVCTELAMALFTSDN